VSLRGCPLLLVAFWLVLLAACGTSPDPVLYTLQPEPGPAQSGGPRIVLLREIGLARYLDRPQIVRASDGVLLDVSKGDWWGEPLGRMIGRLLVDELSQRLPGSTVISETGAITTDSDVTIEVNVQSFAADSSGEVILSAQAAVLPRGHGEPQTLTRRFTARPTDASTRAQVAAMSKLLAELADALAAAVRR
jgi:uncharacterized lipoprotein YmbA